MKSNEIRKKFLNFFQKRGHAIIPSSPLIPENDPTTLFTGSGMQPLVPYLLGELHPKGTRLANSQKSFRAEDIEEIGDNRHMTFFEMLGNWSLGDYFKEEQIKWIFEFLTKEIGLNPKNLYISVFRGNEEYNLPKDEESVAVWKKMFLSAGIKAKVVDLAEKNGLQQGRIFYYSEKKNWWSRPGIPSKMPAGEPGGPNSEIFWDFGEDLKIHENSPYKDQVCHINCDCGRFLEIGNSVFMTYKKIKDGFESLPKKNVDFGGGLERITAVSNNNPDVFSIDLFKNPILVIEEISGKKYKSSENVTKAFRVILDHIRAAVFLISDGAIPSNKDQGYFTRRLLRRAIRFGNLIDIKKFFCEEVGKSFIEEYKEVYPELEKNKDFILEELFKEEEKFKKTLDTGLKELKKIAEYGKIDGNKLFYIYETYGLPIEMSQEIMSGWGMTFDEKTMKEAKDAFRIHQELSRKGAEKKFKSGLADSSEKTTKLHTATHLLQAALRKILGETVSQKGSNITAERLRFDFSYPQKLTLEQIKKIENLVNDKIKENLEVKKEEKSLNEALASGACAFFKEKYPEWVTVYSIGDFSKEICAGPHVKNTKELGHFIIKKEESIGAGVRRIKAILE